MEWIGEIGRRCAGHRRPGLSAGPCGRPGGRRDRPDGPPAGPGDDPLRVRRPRSFPPPRPSGPLGLR